MLLIIQQILQILTDSFNWNKAVIGSKGLPNSICGGF